MTKLLSRDDPSATVEKCEQNPDRCSRVGPSTGAFTAGDLDTAFDLSMRGVGGEHYRSVLEQRLGVNAVNEASLHVAPLLALGRFGHDRLVPSRSLRRYRRRDQR